MVKQVRRKAHGAIDIINGLMHGRTISFKTAAVLNTKEKDIRWFLPQKHTIYHFVSPEIKDVIVEGTIRLRNKGDDKNVVNRRADKVRKRKE